MSYPNTASSLAGYGGALVDYGAIGVVDPTTDRSAANVNQAFADVAAMTHTSGRAWVRFLGHATLPSLALSDASDAAWGNSAPVLPVVTKGGTGIYVVTWPTTITDELGNSQSVVLRTADASVEGSTPYWTPQCSMTSANVVTVYTFNTSAAANDLAGVTIFLQVG